MKKIIDNYYRDYDGEPEVQFISNDGNNVTVFSMWEGYFDQIMTAIEPDENGWTSLSYYYHLCLGWYEDSPWIIDDKDAALRQLKEIDKQNLSEEAKKILDTICDMLNEAILNNNKVSIAIN